MKKNKKTNRLWEFKVGRSTSIVVFFPLIKILFIFLSKKFLWNFECKKTPEISGVKYMYIVNCKKAQLGSGNSKLKELLPSLIFL